MSAFKKQIRQTFRNAVFARDGNKCRVCGKPHTEKEPLDAHHITNREEMPNGGYVKENGISLCAKCHILAEFWHETNGKDWHVGFHPRELYSMIRSDYKQALRASEKLR